MCPNNKITLFVPLLVCFLFCFYIYRGVVGKVSCETSLLLAIEITDDKYTCTFPFFCSFSCEFRITSFVIYNLYIFHNVLSTCFHCVFRNAVNHSLEVVSSTTMAGLTVRCTTMQEEAPCAIAVKSQSQVDVSRPCIVNSIQSTLCAPSVSSN